MATGNDTLCAPFSATARRALLGGAAVLGTAFATASSCQPVLAAGADAGLVALCAAWRRALAREMAVTDRLFATHERDWSDADRDLFDEVGADVSDLERRVFGTRATTLAGIKAKAGVLGHLSAAAGVPTEPEQAASLVADVLAFGGGA